MVLLGCRPPGRHTEQHDIYFGIAPSLKELLPGMRKFWPEGKSNLHIDAWREVTAVDGHAVTVVPRMDGVDADNGAQLFFINLGGYLPGQFDEPHYKMLTVQRDKAAAVKKAKTVPFFKEASLPISGGNSHIDDHFGVDVDDVYNVKDVLSTNDKAAYTLRLEAGTATGEDHLHLGYVKFSALK